MSKLRIIRGKDIVLSLDDEPLFGVTEFSATEKRVFHQVRECMRSAAVKHVPQEAHYQLKLKALNVLTVRYPRTNRSRSPSVLRTRSMCMRIAV